MTLLHVLAIATAALVLWRVEPGINAMTGHTFWMIRWSFLLIGCGAALLLIWGYRPLCPDIPAIHPVIILIPLTSGVGLLLFCERRMSILLPELRKGKHHA